MLHPARTSGAERRRRFSFDTSWLILLAPVLAAAALVIYLHLPSESTKVPVPVRCDESGQCVKIAPLSVVNLFGFSATMPDDPNGDSYIVADNYILSWDKKSEWQEGIDQETALKQDFTYAIQNARLPILTLEPWPTRGRSTRTLLKDVSSGLYDREISWFCTSVDAYGGPAIIRWGHEMENVTGRYPWATKDAAGFVSAYKYFVNKCRAIAPKASFMWSPAGNKNLSDYWPGSEYVDYVGLTVYDYAAWENRYYGYNRSFTENFGERYARVKDYGKTVIIAEFGATGPTKYQWVSSALEEVKNFPLVRGIVFFNAQDPVSWGPMAPPDWRIGLDATPVQPK